MTYMHNGKQYIVIAISGGKYSGELLALTGLTERRNFEFAIHRVWKRFTGSGARACDPDLIEAAMDLM